MTDCNCFFRMRVLTPTRLQRVPRVAVNPRRGAGPPGSMVHSSPYFVDGLEDDSSLQAGLDGRGIWDQVPSPGWVGGPLSLFLCWGGEGLA